MYYADQLGLDKVLAGVKGLGLKPARLLEECVAKGITVAKWSTLDQKAKAAATGSKL